MGEEVGEANDGPEEEAEEGGKGDGGCAVAGPGAVVVHFGYTSDGKRLETELEAEAEEVEIIDEMKAE